MAAWPKGELGGIAKADELRIAPLREDGATCRAPTTIWSVAVDGDLYARAFNGLSSRWRKAAIKQKAGRIEAAGMTKDVTFEPAGGAINDRIDAAYRAKYEPLPRPDDRRPRHDDQDHAARQGFRRGTRRTQCKGASLEKAASKSRRSGSAAWA